MQKNLVLVARSFLLFVYKLVGAYWDISMFANKFSLKKKQSKPPMLLREHLFLLKLIC